MNEIPRQTQGQIKTRAYLKELFENEAFVKEFEEIKAIPNVKKREKKLWKFAEKYSLEYEPGSPLFSIRVGNNPRLDEQIGHELDVCQLYDEVDEYLDWNFPRDFDIPPSRNPSKRLRLYAYPIHIGISTKATKRDVLDFISKRWDYIRYMLDEYESNPKLIRKKRKQERDKYIWENRELPSKELAEKVNHKFPDECLTYADINSIKNYLRKRKSQL